MAGAELSTRSSSSSTTVSGESRPTSGSGRGLASSSAGACVTKSGILHRGDANIVPVSFAIGQIVRTLERNSGAVAIVRACVSACGGCAGVPDRRQLTHDNRDAGAYAGGGRPGGHGTTGSMLHARSATTDAGRGRLPLLRPGRRRAQLLSAPVPAGHTHRGRQPDRAGRALIGAGRRAWRPCPRAGGAVRGRPPDPLGRGLRARPVPRRFRAAGTGRAAGRARARPADRRGVPALLRLTGAS